VGNHFNSKEDKKMSELSNLAQMESDLFPGLTFEQKSIEILSHVFYLHVFIACKRACTYKE